MKIEKDKGSKFYIKVARAKDAQMLPDLSTGAHSHFN